MWGAIKESKQLTKADTEQTYRTVAITYIHTHKPDEDEIIRRKERR